MRHHVFFSSMKMGPRVRGDDNCLLFRCSAPPRENSYWRHGPALAGYVASRPCDKDGDNVFHCSFPEQPCGDGRPPDCAAQLGGHTAAWNSLRVDLQPEHDLLAFESDRAPASSIFAQFGG
jgi:hypothetical protein